VLETQAQFLNRIFLYIEGKIQCLVSGHKFHDSWACLFHNTKNTLHMCSAQL